MAISLDFYPWDFEFSGYEGLIHQKICSKNQKDMLGIKVGFNQPLNSFDHYYFIDYFGL